MSQPRSRPAPPRPGRLGMFLVPLVPVAALPLALLTGATPSHAAVRTAGPLAGGSIPALTGIFLDGPRRPSRSGATAIPDATRTGTPRERRNR